MTDLLKFHMIRKDFHLSTRIQWLNTGSTAKGDDRGMKNRSRKWLATLAVAAPAGMMVLGTEPSFAQSASAQKITITMWNPSSGYPYTILAKDFERTHPDVNVKIVQIPTSDNYIKYTTAIDAGTGPDLIMTYGYQPLQSWAADHLLLPLDAVVKQYHFKIPDYWPQVTAAIHYGGKLYGLPVEVDEPLLLWNKTMFKKAGLTKPPQTAAELLADEKRLTVFKNGQLVQAGLVPADRWGLHIWPYFFGGQWYDPGSGHFVANNPHNIAAFHWLASMYKTLGGVAQATAFESSIKTGNAFLAGKEAMEIGGEWVPLEATPSLTLLKGIDVLAPGGTAAVMKTPILNYGFAPVPVGPGLQPGSQTLISPGNTFVIPRGATHIKTTLELMMWFAGEYSSNYYNVNSLDLPPFPSQAKVGSSFWNQSPAERPWLLELDRAGMNAKPVTTLPIYGYWSTTRSNIEQEIIRGATNPEQGLAQLNDEANNYLAQFKATHPN